MEKIAGDIGAVGGLHANAVNRNDDKSAFFLDAVATGMQIAAFRYEKLDEKADLLMRNIEENQDLLELELEKRMNSNES